MIKPDRYPAVSKYNYGIAVPDIIYPNESYIPPDEIFTEKVYKTFDSLIIFYFIM